MNSPEESTEIIKLQEKFSSNLFSNSFKSQGDDFLSRLEPAKTSLISDYHAKIHELQRSNKRARIDFENDIDAARKESKKYRSDNERLRADLAANAANAAKLKQSHEELLATQQKAARLHEQRLAKLEETNRALQTERDNLRDSKTKLETEKTKEIWRLQKELGTTQLDKEQADSTYKLECSRVQKLQEKVASLEASLHDMTDLKVQIKELEKFRDQYHEDATMVKILKAQYKDFPEVQKEYAILKTRQENTMLLNEKYEALKEKSERWEERLAIMDKICTENEELKRQLSKWTVPPASPASQNPRSVEDLMHQLVTLQRSEAVLLANQSTLQARIGTIEDALRNKENENTDLITALSAEKGKRVALEDQARRVDRKLTLIKTERDHYREIIDTYERDCTVTLPAVLSARTQEQHAQVVRELEAQCRDLENKLQEVVKVHTATATMQQQRIVAAKSSTSQTGSIVAETDKKVISQLREQISQLEKKLEKVSEEKFQVESIMERYHLQGAYDPRTTKVVQLGANPASLARRERSDEVARLTEANRHLSERVRILEENERLIEDITTQVQCNVVQKASSTQQIDELNAKMKSAELTNTRLIEAFRKTSNDLRTACYCLTGYQINVLSGSKYRVTHMFSASPDDYLLFRLDAHSDLELLESPYSATLTDLMDLYLTKQRSLPAFMSALALDLFGKRTISL